MMKIGACSIFDLHYVKEMPKIFTDLNFCMIVI